MPNGNRLDVETKKINPLYLRGHSKATAYLTAPLGVRFLLWLREEKTQRYLEASGTEESRWAEARAREAGVTETASNGARCEGWDVRNNRKHHPEQ